MVAYSAVLKDTFPSSWYPIAGVIVLFNTGTAAVVWSQNLIVPDDVLFTYIPTSVPAVDLICADAVRFL